MPCARLARSFAALAASALLACAHARSQSAAAEPDRAPTGTVTVGEQPSGSPGSDAGTARKQEQAPKSVAAIAEFGAETLFYTACILLGGGLVYLALEYPIAAAVGVGGLIVWANVQPKSSHASAPPSVEESAPSDAPHPPGR